MQADAGAVFARLNHDIYYEYGLNCTKMFFQFHMHPSVKSFPAKLHILNLKFFPLQSQPNASCNGRASNDENDARQQINIMSNIHRHIFFLLSFSPSASLLFSPPLHLQLVCLHVVRSN